MPLIPTFAHILAKRTYASIHISVHYTKAVDPQVATKVFTQNPLPEDLTLHTGRPRLAQYLDEVINDARSMNVIKRSYRKSVLDTASTSTGSGPCGVIVGVCGPGGLADDVRRVIGDVDPSRRKQVGGVEFHEE